MSPAAANRVTHMGRAAPSWRRSVRSKATCARLRTIGFSEQRVQFGCRDVERHARRRSLDAAVLCAERSHTQRCAATLAGVARGGRTSFVLGTTHYEPGVVG